MNICPQTIFKMQPSNMLALSVYVTILNPLDFLFVGTPKNSCVFRSSC